MYAHTRLLIVNHKTSAIAKYVLANAYALILGTISNCSPDAHIYAHTHSDSELLLLQYTTIYYYYYNYYHHYYYILPFRQ